MFFSSLLNKCSFSVFILLLVVSVTCMERPIDNNLALIRLAQEKQITAGNLDSLVLEGVKHIHTNGERFTARAGDGKQAYNVSYTLLNPLNRIHNLRKPASIKYFCRELLAYFKGSLNVDDGLTQAAPFWKTLANEKNQICSNYGYYVFHQKINEMTQYEWVIKNLEKNIDSRKAFININQPLHKDLNSKDFPCTIGLQFFVEQNYLCCSASSRSTDIYTGLPYDMGFFAFVTELVYRDLKQRLPQEKAQALLLGYVTMKTNFTQIYDKTSVQALKLLEKYGTMDSNNAEADSMPQIENAQETLNDIYNGTSYCVIMKWIYENAKFPK